MHIIFALGTLLFQALAVWLLNAGDWWLGIPCIFIGTMAAAGFGAVLAIIGRD